MRLKVPTNYLIPSILFLAYLLAGGCVPCEARWITDMAGRNIKIPNEIRKVYGTSLPATYMVYAIDPGLVVGLNFPLNPAACPFIDQRMRQLPVIGGWFGQGRTANLETLIQMKPDIILVWMWQMPSANEKLMRMLKPLDIPIVYLVMDDLDGYPAAFLFLGELFGQSERARVLSRYCEQTLKEAEKLRNTLAKADRCSVYYAEGPDGLSTECHTSIHARLIPLSGGKNVHQCIQSRQYGMQKISMEQVLIYNPDVIVFHEPLFAAELSGHRGWQNLRAVIDGRVYRIPRLPFNWFDRPPSFMRLLGLKWMMHHLYPDDYPIDMVSETQNFYGLFLNVTLDVEAARELLEP